jgi:hypothetical protein
VSIWDDLQKGVRSVADAVSKEAGKVSLQTQISEVERQVWALYSQMGYRALELLRAGTIADEKLGELDTQVQALQAKLADLQARVAAGEQPTPPQAAADQTPPPADPA